MENEENSLAYEILKENKILTKRLFAICIIEFAIIVGMIIGFFVYESQFDYSNENYQSMEDTNESSNIIQKIGE